MNTPKNTLHAKVIRKCLALVRRPAMTPAENKNKKRKGLDAPYLGN